jgi:hypothetical protein
MRVREVEFRWNVDEGSLMAFLRTVGSSLEVMKLENTRDHTNIIGQHATAFCTRLRRIDLSDYCDISGEVFSELLRARATSLTELNLWWPALPPFEVHTTMEALQVLNITLESARCRESIVALIRHCPNLKFFNHCSENEPAIPGVYLTALTQSCPHLQKLRGTIATEDVQIYIAVLEACTELTNVDLCNSAEHHIRILQATIDHCATLRALSLSESCEEAFAVLIPRIRELEYLSLDARLENALTMMVELTAHCSHLKSLHFYFHQLLFGLPDEDAAERAVQRLFRCLTRIEELDLSDAYWLKDAHVLTIAAHSPRLRKIFVPHQLVFKVATITALVQSCVDLELILLRSAPPKSSSRTPYLWSEENKQPWRALRPRLRVSDDEPESRFGYWAR